MRNPDSLSPVAMKYSLDNLFPVVLPDIPPALVGSEALKKIRLLARLLPPVYCSGFECRLGRNAPRVDLHQCISSDNEPAILIDHIASSSDLGHPAWKQIRSFCKRWSKSSSILNRIVESLWLEIDDRDTFSTGVVPSVFVSLKKEGSLSLSEKELEQVVLTALSLLRDRPASKHLINNLRRCYDACPEGGGITHIGTMLSRDSRMVRLNIGGLTPEHFSSYLRHIGWPGPILNTTSELARFGRLVDSVILCLDVGDGISPEIGMECLFSGNSTDLTGWSGFLTYLVDCGLCIPEKADALLAWPGVVVPTSVADCWPNELIIESLLESDGKFTQFIRKLSHIKIIVGPRRAIAAKAYFGVVHGWANLDEARQPGPVL